MGGIDMKILGKIIFQSHPAVLVADFATPGANLEHPFQVMEALDQAFG